MLISKFSHFFFALLASPALDIIFISMSTVMLNLSRFKQYPSYWFGFSWKHSAGIAVGPGWCARRKKEKQEDDAAYAEGTDGPSIMQSRLGEA